jgi:DNA polymerase-3 subunit delta'
VLSRCQRVVFRRADRETVITALRDRGADAQQAETIAAAAVGRIGWAFRALADPSLLMERTKLLDDALRVAHADRIGRFGWARENEGRTAEVRERYLRVLDVWEEWWRDVLLAVAGGEGLLNRDREAALREEGRLYKASDVVRFLQVLLKTREYLYANVDPQLALENLMLDLPSRQPARI